jgi:16S rRNA (guanine1207-N2)-methyltransferase
MRKRTYARSQRQSADYYAWETDTVSLRDLDLQLCTKPGMPEWEALDPATALLAENMICARDGRVLVLNCGAGLVGAVAAQQVDRGGVILCSDNALDLAAARRTIEANGIGNASVVPSVGAEAIDEDDLFDVIALRMPKGRLPALKLAWEARQHLAPGGRILIGGASNEGIKSCLKQVASFLGETTAIGYRKGHRVAMAEPRSPQPSPPDPWLDPARRHEFAVTEGGVSLTLRTRPGIFSWEGLDGGTAALLREMTVRPDDRVLDLGCGCGVAGLLASRLAPQGSFRMVDASLQAVQATQENTALNEAPNCHVALSDCALAVADEQFDLVISNPPFHQGKGTMYRMAAQFIKDAARLLAPGGRFELVANRFLRYESLLDEAFGAHERIWEDNKFKVIRATR